MTSVLVLSRGWVGPRMAASGIRAYQIAGALGRTIPDAEITLAVPAGKDAIAPPAPNVVLREWKDNAEADRLSREADVAIARNFPPRFIPIMGGHTRFALDAFTPHFIEWMELSRRDIEPKWRRTWMSGNRWYLNFQLTLADFIFCADERQRDMWIGALMALSLVPPDMYERDPSLRRFIDIVPFGVSQGPFTARPGRIKGTVEGINPGDPVILWNGGITEWNDPVTLIEAVARLLPRHPNLRVVFMGVNHPDMVTGPGGGATLAAIEATRRLGLEGKNVFFLSGWVPYSELDDYLADADLSVCLGFENVESRFAFRTRYVDLFRGRVPIVCTRGDVLAERVEVDPLGLTVPERDVSAVTEAIDRLLTDQQFVANCRENLAAIGQELAWDTAIQPLSNFVTSGERYSMPASRRRMQAAARAGYYYAMKRICRSQPYFQ